MGQSDVANCSGANFKSEKYDEKIADRNLDAADIPGVMIRDDLSAANDGSYDTDEEELAVDSNNGWRSLDSGEL